MALCWCSAFVSGIIRLKKDATTKSGKLRSISAISKFESDPFHTFFLPNRGEKIRRRGFSAAHSAMEEVKATSAWVATRSSHVFVDSSGLDKIVDEIQGSIPKVEWDFEGIHYFDNGPLTIQYLFVLDALNFCFWPDKDLNYDNLALGLKVALQNDKSAFDADRLQSYTGPQLRKLLNWPRPLPLEDERIRLLHEVGLELERSFAGKAANLVEASGKSAVSLVALITRHFPGFRDHSLYKGHQVFLYKRAQIFAADLWGAFKGQGYGEFYDISSITIFADYIVPAVLRRLGVLRYSSALAGIIDANDEIGSGSEEEVEIRACTIYAVEKMKDLIKAKFGKQIASLTNGNDKGVHEFLRASSRHSYVLSPVPLVTEEF